MNPVILQALDNGTTVITATQRLSYEVKAAYDAQQLAQNKTVWPSPKLHTWDSWMQSLWQAHSAHSDTLCLTASQLQQLMHDVITTHANEHNTLNALFNTTASARIALDAWKICHQWQISYTALQTATHLDHAQFGRWANQLYAALRNKNWISSSEIVSTLISQKTKALESACLFGFDFLSPEQQSLIDYASTLNKSIVQIQRKTKPSKTISRIEFEDTKQEWQQIGAWARTKLSQNLNQKIGIISPNVEKNRLIATQCLREQLIPNYYAQTVVDPFHFSQGVPLSDVPIIKSALGCLTLLSTLEFDQLNAIFASNYWGSQAEQALRAQLISRLGQHIAFQFDLFELIRAIENLSNNTANTLIFIEKLKQLQMLKTANRASQTLSSWRELFRDILIIAQWPASKIDSDEFQAKEAWDHCLDDWAKLDLVCTPMAFQTALHSLKSHCQQTQFQSQAHANTPIQIMGVLEAAELDFDAVWLTGFDEQSWPSSTHANPFIPIKTQINAGYHPASTKLQADYSALKTTQLLGLCHEIHISHTRTEADIELSISPLFLHLPASEHSELPPAFDLNAATRLATPNLVCTQDDFGVPLTEDKARGGTGIITAQSACPFQAYAKYRLKASAQASPEMGLDNLVRGSLLHDILADIWHVLGNSDTLQHYIKSDQLDELIANKTQRQVSLKSKNSGLGDGFLTSECTRLNALLKEWLMLESTRPTFSVEMIEQEREYEINGLKLNFKLDRVDQLSSVNKARFIIDYKSGKFTLKDWASTRPKQPQIPLYYLALESEQSTPSQALGFSQVKQGECQFIGASEDETGIEGVSTFGKLRGAVSLKKEADDWADLKPIWQERLGILADEIQAGTAHVDPKDAQSCEYCDLASLCRINTQDKAKHEATDSAD